MVGKRTSPLIRWYLDSQHENIPIDVYLAFRDEFINELLENPEGVTLPLNLGWMKIVGNQGPAVSKGNTARFGSWERPSYVNNNHSDGWIFKVTWYSKPLGKTEDIVKKAFFNSDAYGFSPTDKLRRALTEKVLKGEWNHFQRKGFFRSPRIRDKIGRPRNSDIAKIELKPDAD